MKKITTLILLAMSINGLYAQSLKQYYQQIQQYEPSEEHPFGQINPNAAPELKEFDFMIGICDCTDSISQLGGDWLVFPSIWRAKYFLNGLAIQDNNFNPQNPTSNLRLFDVSTKKWKVTYASTAQRYFTGEWVGRKEKDGTIVLYRRSGEDQPYSRLTFYDISEKGYSWKSETVFPNGDVQVGWSKKCVKREP